MYVGSAVRDAAGVAASPGAAAVAGGRVVAAGKVDSVLAATGDAAERVDCQGRLLLPGLVNAHAHLDLTDLGPRPFGGDFAAWARMVMAERPTEPDAVRAAVQHGARRSLAAGVMRIGDIAGCPEATTALAASGLGGVSFAELVGIGGPTLDRSMRRLQEVAGRPWVGDVRQGLQPHAPYSAGPALYGEAARLAREHGLPLSTHLAETEAERRFVAEAEGPFRGLLESLGKWDPAHERLYGHGLDPVDWLMQTVDDPDHPPPWLCAHCNYVTDRQIERLRRAGASVAYCPRASEYFGHSGHRYRQMIEAGLNVCLGTDSIVCHGTLSIVDEMRRLHQRDGTDPDLLLRMATINGMRGLQLEPNEATFAPGAAAGLLALPYDGRPGVEPLAEILGAETAPQIEPLEPAGHTASRAHGDA